MTLPENAFKTALRDRRRIIGLWLAMADAYAAEIAGHTGFDWLVIDGEHGPNDLRSILAQLQALQASPSEIVVRAPVGETWMIKQDGVKVTGTTKGEKELPLTGTVEGSVIRGLVTDGENHYQVHLNVDGSDADGTIRMGKNEFLIMLKKK